MKQTLKSNKYNKYPESEFNTTINNKHNLLTLTKGESELTTMGDYIRCVRIVN